MADVKITSLAASTAPVLTDVIPFVSDPTGTPVTKKMTLSTLLNMTTLYSIVPAGDFALGTGTAVQAAFPAAGDTFTLKASTTYKFEGAYYITKSGTTGTTGMAFALGGGASVTSIQYWASAINAAANTTGATTAMIWVDTVNATVINATGTTALVIRFEGIIRMNAGGTVTPQIIFSAAPTSPVMKANSYIRFEEWGTNTTNTQGAVA